MRTKWLAASAVLVFVLTAGFLFVYTDRTAGSVYGERLQELPSYQQKQVIQMFEFLDGKNEVPEMTGAEEAHMHDVRNLIGAVKIAFTLSLAMIIIMWWYGLLGKGIVPGVLGACGVMVLMAVLAAVGFSSFWFWFHQVMMPQGNWIFPEDSTLITLFPLEFFLHYSREVIVSTIAVGVFGYCVSLFGHPLESKE